MKVRSDFVTNSSSSSFVAYGVSRWDLSGELEDKFEELYEIWQEDWEFEGSNVTFENDEYIGVELSTLIKKYPEEKVKDLPDLAAKELEALFGAPVKVHYIEEATYNG